MIASSMATILQYHMVEPTATRLLTKARHQVFEEIVMENMGRLGHIEKMARLGRMESSTVPAASVCFFLKRVQDLPKAMFL